MTHKHCCCATDDAPVKIETLTLDDGRRAERHTTLDANGNEIVEIFAEEKRPLKLEKRIHREMKNIISKETHETIKDGEVAYQEVRSLEPEVPLQVRSKIGVADHAKIVDGDYVRKDEINQLVENSVVAGITALMQSYQPIMPVAPEKVTAQAMVEKNVEEKKKSDVTTMGIMAAIVVVQLLFLGYVFLN